jgi:hypothetical protein
MVNMVALPTFFAEPDIPVADLLTEVRWQIKGEHIEMEVTPI